MREQGSRGAEGQLPITNYQLPITNYQLPIVCRLYSISINVSIVLVIFGKITEMLGVIAYIGFLGGFFALAVGLLFGLRAAKII
ncbi:MAG: hypothetical protein CLLPBCKN_000056 [Chroococcidiopsis cubana SAG 39.79]|jgi:cytochrome b6-f complex subunit 6|nr:cytochrome b6-f complex subunit PetL [Chroococcidiopsis cubana]MDZ4870668.1 hypothetical protein [Chroococcidiopsis cubana SAG 39.79]